MKNNDKNKDKDDELNIKLMQEIGLEPRKNQYLVDQDTGDTLQFNKKFLVPPGTQVDNKDTMTFDPVNNVKLMSHLFGYYANKLDEDDDNKVNVFYTVNGSNNKKFLEVKDVDNNTIKSKEYSNDSLIYADVILRLNGEEDVDLSKYDSDRSRKQTIKRTSRIKKNENSKGVNKK